MGEIDTVIQRPGIITSAMPMEASPIASSGRGVALLPDPGFLWQVFRRNMFLSLAVASAVIAATLFLVSRLTPIYATTASVLIEPTGDPIRTTAPGQRNGIVNADEVDTEIRLIGSPLVLRRAADLYADNYAAANGAPMPTLQREAVRERIERGIRVTRSGQTRIADITAIDPDPDFAAQAANLVAQSYLNSQVDAKSSRSGSSQEFINARLFELERNALNAQAALDNYRNQQGLVSAQGSTNAEQEVSTLNQQLATARADLAQERGRLQAARSQLARGGAGEDIGAALGSGTISGLRAQESLIGSRVASLSERYGPLHPERQQAEAELRVVRNQIAQEIGRIISSLEANVQTTSSRVQSLERSRSNALSRLEGNSLAQAGLNRLQQQADAAQSIYQSFLERSQETGALRDSATPDAVIAARAEVPEIPVAPRTKVITAGGVIFGLALGFAAILIAEYLRRGVQTKRDVERRLSLRYAGAVPTLKSTLGWRRTKLKPHEYVVEHPHSLFAESFRSIRAFLTLSPGSRPRAIAVTSALPAEGKTTTTLCLALTTAAEGNKTILVDSDLRRRGASRLVRYNMPFDIYDYMLGDAPLEKCLHVDPQTGLRVLGSNSSPTNPSNPMREDLIKDMFDELRRTFDVVIIDTSPILGVSDGRIIATLADRVLIVTRWKKTSMRAVEAVSSMLINTKAKVTGLALTQVNIKKYASTGDGDVYAYTKKFKGYYTS